jgi:PKHD-type hydroxylase
MKNNYSFIVNAFSEDECRKVIGLGLAEPLEPAYSPGMEIDPELRSSMVRFIYTEDGREWIFNKLWELTRSVDHGLEIDTLNFVQFTEYDASYFGHFSKHTDTQNFYHPTNRGKRIRRLTCVIQLSDPTTYEGGSLVLYPTKESAITGLRDRGCAIMFPSNMIHEAQKVTVGTRYSLVAWFEGLR